MKEVETRPGKTYAVECVGEVVVTNTETGAVVAQGDGGGQVLFTACGSSYTVSDDTAKVVALFKLAPRLKLALLQGVAGGWLPKGFTELDYLESSGTQYIDTGISGNNTSEIRCAFRVQYITGSGLRTYGSYAGGSNITFYCSSNPGGNVRFGNTTQLIKTDNGVDYSVTQNAQGVTVNGAFYSYSEVLPFVTHSTLYIFNINGFDSGEMLNGLFYYFEHIKDGKIVMSLRPVLNADGVPGMWDMVSKRFLENDGTGTFGYRIKGTDDVVKPNATTYSLRAPRDPYYVAPSGVYARKVGENELEVIADTEAVSGEDWVWFANTGEAYEHFGIVQDNEELLTE